MFNTEDNICDAQFVCKTSTVFNTEDNICDVQIVCKTSIVFSMEDNISDVQFFIVHQFFLEKVYCQGDHILFARF